MKDKYTDIDALLAKRFAGEATSNEEVRIGEWLKATPDNEQYYADALWLWDQMSKGKAQPKSIINTEDALAKVKVQIKSAPKHPFWLTRRVWSTAIAASLAVAMAAVYFFRSNATSPAIEMATKQSIMTDTLMDGSEVTLNRQSAIVIASGYNKKERRVRLQGEAYFKVTPDQTRPFVVEMKQVEVQVVGTAFNLDEISEPNHLIVSILEGKVRVKTVQAEVYLLAGESASVDQTTGAIQQLKATNPNVLAYRDQKFHFDQTPLKTVLQQIQSAYHVEISLTNQALLSCPLSARFEGQSLDRVVDILVETFNLSLEKQGNTIILKGGSCDGQ
jgi:transmembrane sensor